MKIDGKTVILQIFPGRKILRSWYTKPLISFKIDKIAAIYNQDEAEGSCHLKEIIKAVTKEKDYTPTKICVQNDGQIAKVLNGLEKHTKNLHGEKVNSFNDYLKAVLLKMWTLMILKMLYAYLDKYLYT